MALELEVEVLPEDPLEPLDAPLCLLYIAVHDMLWDLPPEAGGGGDDPLVVLLQQLLIYTGAVVVSVYPGTGDHLDEVLVAREVLGQQNEVPATIIYRLGGAIGVGDVGLLAEA